MPEKKRQKGEESGLSAGSGRKDTPCTPHAPGERPRVAAGVKKRPWRCCWVVVVVVAVDDQARDASGWGLSWRSERAPCEAWIVSEPRHRHTDTQTPTLTTSGVLGGGACSGSSRLAAVRGGRAAVTGGLQRRRRGVHQGKEENDPQIARGSPQFRARFSCPHNFFGPTQTAGA